MDAAIWTIENSVEPGKRYIAIAEWYPEFPSSMGMLPLKWGFVRAGKVIFPENLTFDEVVSLCESEGLIARQGATA